VQAEPWKYTWPSEVEQAIARLESAVASNARDVWSLNPFADQPISTPHHHIMVALSYMSNFNFRPAIREYEKVLAVSPHLADPHWGIAVSLYSLAILDMLVRGLCIVSKSEVRFITRRMNEESYLRRETKILAQGALVFTSAAGAMQEQGWQQPELIAAISVVLAQTPGLIPDARQGINIFRAGLPTELVPLATCSPDRPARVLLDLSNQQFIAGNMYDQIRVPPNVLDFFDYEMQSVQGRVQELLRTPATRTSAEPGSLSSLRARFDAVRGESDATFELFSRVRTNALHERNPGACVHAGAMFLGGAFYTVAEEMFRKALELLPTSTGALWGLAQTYYGLGLFDLLERGRFSFRIHEIGPDLVSRIRRAPLKYEIGAILGLSTVRTFDHVFAGKGVERSQLRSLFSVLRPERDHPLPTTVPIPTWQPDEQTLALWHLALEYAERAQNGPEPAGANRVIAFDPADLEAFHTHLAAVSGRTITHKSTPGGAPRSAKGPLREAKELYHQRQFEKAAELLDQSIQAGPEDAETWNWRNTRAQFTASTRRFV
jgi:tetratricopeptide (TPR) repeat protein